MVYGPTKIVCEYNGYLWRIIGYNGNNLSIISRLDGSMETIVLSEDLNKVCLIDDIHDCYTYDQLQKKYPEYTI